MTRDMQFVRRSAFTYPQHWKSAMELIKYGNCVVVNRKRYWLSEWMIIELAQEPVDA